MTWGIWNTERQGWAALNNVVFSAKSKSVCVAQIELIQYLNRQHHIEQHGQEQAPQPEPSRVERIKSLLKRNGKKAPAEPPPPFDSAKIPDPPLVPRRFEEWYQKKLMGGKR